MLVAVAVVDITQQAHQVVQVVAVKEVVTLLLAFQELLT
jgi:hypothetical protein